MTKMINATMSLGRVVAHEVLSPRYRRLTLHAPHAAQTVRAGQFLHVLTRDVDCLDPFLRRAFSIMRAEGDEIVLLYRIEGRGTALLSKKNVGDAVDFVGPLGQPFAPVTGDAIFVGGGVGVPPLVMLAHQTARESISDLDEKGFAAEWRAIVGARTSEDVLGVADFAACGVAVDVATEDGSAGEQGRVTDILLRSLQARKPREGASLTVFSCGPLPMLRAVAQLCAKFEVPCQVSLEENMPCGIGVCNGCVIEAARPENEYSIYRRICVEGPVLWAHEIKW